jgi:monolysocardiolipin acyltransferase
MMSSILPLWMSMEPRYVRWSVCSQEFCFNPEYSSLIHAFSGLGKVMPIRRGGGINQKLLLDFARRLAAGDWCHVFPEGGIWQKPVLGGRDNGSEKELGHLKWGVGKLIAHSPKRAIVIPFFQFGMETLLPQDPVTKKLDSMIPKPGHNVKVRFGVELDFDDLIKEHEELHGQLWKYKASVDEEIEGQDFHLYWDSRPEEMILYHKITLR